MAARDIKDDWRTKIGLFVERNYADGSESGKTMTIEEQKTTELKATEAEMVEVNIK